MSSFAWEKKSKHFGYSYEYDCAIAGGAGTAIKEGLINGDPKWVVIDKNKGIKLVTNIDEQPAMGNYYSILSCQILK